MAVETSCSDLVKVCQTHGITVDVLYVEDEFQDADRRWHAISMGTQELLKDARRAEQQQREEEISPVEEAVTEAQIVETEAEPVNWEMLLTDPTYAEKVEVSTEKLTEWILM